MLKKILSTTLSLTLLAGSFAILPKPTASAEGSLFDEWDWQNLSSRYTRQAEKLDRGVVAVRMEDMDHVFVSWRLNGYEPKDAMFNIYRDGELITSEPVYLTNYEDPEGTINSAYAVGLVVNGEEVERSEPVGVLDNQYLEIKLAEPPKVTTYDIVSDASSEITDEMAVFEANDVHTADLDGDGLYDFVVKLVPSNQNDPMGNLADKTYLDAYTMDGEHLWRIDIGPNIRSQRHGIQPLVYDFDGDGRAEVAVITGDGAVSLKPNPDGNGTYGTFGGFDSQPDVYGTLDSNYDVISVIGDPREVGKSVQYGRWVQEKKYDYLNQEGPLYLSIFDGLTGEEIQTIPYDPQTSREGYEIAVNGYPEGPITVDGFTFDGYDLPEGAMPINTAAENGANSWGNYTNHPWRMNAAVAYLDGETPGMVFQRGIYMGRVALAAYTLERTSDGERYLVQEWRADTYDSSADGGQPRFGGIDAQGNHNISVGDLDGSGRDSVIIGASAIKYDGTLLWTTGRGHGDAQHLGKYDPTKPGLQFMSVHERSAYGFSFLNAEDGSDIWRQRADSDTGRGIIGIWGDFDGSYAQLSATEGAGAWAYMGGSGSGAFENIDGRGLPSSTDANGENTSLSANFRIYWDGSLWDQALDGYDPTGEKTTDMEYGIYKYNEETEQMELIFSTEGCETIDFTKKPPCAVADIFGDWREEFIAGTADHSAIRIYTTVIPTEYRYYTFMHDALYRVSAARQYSGYNQPPHIGFYLADRDGYRDLQPQANIYLADGTGIFIDSQPAEEENVIFGNINSELKVEAAANPSDTELTYQWYETDGAANDFSRRPKQGTPIQGATDSTYVVPTDLEVGEHYYYCVVSDASGELSAETSFVSKVNVMASAQIEVTSQPPASLSAIVGQINNSLSVAAKVTPEDDLSYQWYVCSSEDGSGAEAIPGATSTEFKLPEDLKVGTYYYYCLVSAEGAQNVQSRVTAVTVNYDIYRWYDGNSFTDPDDLWLTEGYGVAVGPSKEVVTTPIDGIPGMIDSYLSISGEMGGNRASAVKLEKPVDMENNVYYFEYDVKFNGVEKGFADISLWPDIEYNSGTTIGNTAAIFRLTRNSAGELYWSVNTARAADAGTMVEELSGSAGSGKWIRVQVTLDYENQTGTLALTSLEPEDDISYKADFSLEGVPDNIGVFGVHGTRSSSGANISVDLANVNFFTVDDIPASMSAQITENTLRAEDGSVTGDVTVNVVSNVDAQPSAVILALYNGNGQLVFSGTEELVLVEGDNTVTYSNITIPNMEDAYNAKVFVWDSFDRMAPLCSPYVAGNILQAATN